MSFVGKNIDRPVPEEDGCVFHFVELTGEQLDEAERAQQKKALGIVTELSPEAIAQVFASRSGKKSEDTSKSFDPDVLIKFGIAGWDGGEYNNVPCDDANKRRLSGRTRDWAATQIESLSTYSVGED